MALRDTGSLVCVYHSMQQVGLARSELGNQLGIWSITEGIASLAHDIKGLLRLMGWREPAAGTPSG